MENETPLDPFAVDFFGVRAPARIEEIEAFEEQQTPIIKQRQLKKRTDWFAGLPKLSRDEVEFSNALQNIPAETAEQVSAKTAAILEHYTFSQPETVKCSLISTSEVDLHSAVNELTKSPKIFLTQSCQPERHPALICFNTDFAASIINLTLGGKSAEISPLKRLSAIERSILEFLSVNVFSELNDLFGQKLFCLHDVDEITPEIFDERARGAEVVFRIDFSSFSGIITFLASKDFLSVINRNNFSKKAVAENKLFKLGKYASLIDLKLSVGTTNIEADALPFLEPGDVILIEKPEISGLNPDLSEVRQFFAGNGTSVRLTGNFVSENFIGKSDFQIKEFLSEEARRVSPFAKFTMDVNENVFSEMENEAENEPFGDNEPFDEAAEDLSALENVQVNLRVEIAADKISLRELQNFRAGQIIALGCRPTDPVRLITDDSDQPIATGELVEIEGQLGVRLTKVLI